MLHYLHYRYGIYGMGDCCATTPFGDSGLMSGLIPDEHLCVHRTLQHVTKQDTSPGLGDRKYY